MSTRCPQVSELSVLAQCNVGQILHRNEASVRHGDIVCRQEVEDDGSTADDAAQTLQEQCFLWAI